LSVPGRFFTAELSGTKVKHISCQKCGDNYVYVLRRTGEGTGKSVLWLDNDGARGSADTSARQDLHAKLAKGVDPVACPACGWYQKTMVAAVRARRRAWADIGAMALGVGALFAMCSGRMLLAEALFGAAVVVAVAARVIVSRWDPNADEVWKQKARERESGRAMRRADYEAAKAHGAGGAT
jgi:hypothetical protein